MSDPKTDDLNTGTFDTWALIEKRKAADAIAVVEVNDKAATRQAIIVALRRDRFTFETRSDWNAKSVKKSDGPDWKYHGIALHHAGNSFSCDADGAAQIHKVEQTDISSFGHISYHYAIACGGNIFEALDIREKGAHIASGNTGVIGIVMLADLSLPGEAYREEYENKSFVGKVRGAFEWVPDQLSTTPHEPPEAQTKALFALVKVLCQYFPVTMLGGHREFQKLSTGEGRACPGALGMILVDKLRGQYKLGKPTK